MEKKTKMLGIDVSHWNGEIDFEKVAKTGIQFVMIKIGGYENDKVYHDENFTKNYDDAKKAGLHVGCYIYVGESCNSIEKADYLCCVFEDEIKCFYEFDMPIAVDIEEGMTTDVEKNSSIVNRICERFENSGYYVSIYGSEVFCFKGIINLKRTESHDRWVAKYSFSQPELDCGMWQFSSRHMIDGINGYVDMNASFKDYPQIINKMKERAKQ